MGHGMGVERNWLTHRTSVSRRWTEMHCWPREWHWPNSLRSPSRADIDQACPPPPGLPTIDIIAQLPLQLGSWATWTWSFPLALRSFLTKKIKQWIPLATKKCAFLGKSFAWSGGSMPQDGFLESQKRFIRVKCRRKLTAIILGVFPCKHMFLKNVDLTYIYLGILQPGLTSPQEGHLIC